MREYWYCTLGCGFFVGLSSWFNLYLGLGILGALIGVTIARSDRKGVKK